MSYDDDSRSPHTWEDVRPCAFTTVRHSHGMVCSACYTRRSVYAEPGCYHNFCYLPGGLLPWHENEPQCPPVGLREGLKLCWEEEPPYGARSCTLTKGHEGDHKFSYGLTLTTGEPP